MNRAAWLAITVSLALASCKKKSDHQAGAGAFTVTYGAAGDRGELLDELRESRFFEVAASALTEAVKLPRDVNTVIKSCGEINAFYSPAEREVTMCLELVDEIGVRAEQAAMDDTEAAGPLIMIYFHEVGHALIDVLELPITGREEDAVDQLATALMVDEGTDEGLSAAIGAALFFQPLADDRRFRAEFAFWDEHSLDEQRFFNILCWAYGAAPDKLDHLVDDDVLPAERADRCPDEYAKLKAGWEALLKKHVRN